MTSFLFWNVDEHDLCPLLGRAAHRHGIDVLMLVESATSDDAIVAALRANTARFFAAHSEVNDKVRVFSTIPPRLWTRYHPASDRLSAWHVRRGKPEGFTLFGAHLVSQNNNSEIDQALLTTEIATELRRVEETIGHRRSVLAGDLNMNPYDAGMTGANALNAVMCQAVAERETRTVQKNDHPFFYNPMWGLFGDRTPGPAGTYYYSKGVVAAHWHILDQVLLRPPLMSQLQDVQILASIDGESLLSRDGLPNRTAYSDHLPVLFRMNLD